jgi:hypothetical protein
MLLPATATRGTTGGQTAYPDSQNGGMIAFHVIHPADGTPPSFHELPDFAETTAHRLNLDSDCQGWESVIYEHEHAQEFSMAHASMRVRSFVCSLLLLVCSGKKQTVVASPSQRVAFATAVVGGKQLHSQHRH